MSEPSTTVPAHPTGSPDPSTDLEAALKALARPSPPSSGVSSPIRPLTAARAGWSAARTVVDGHFALRACFVNPRQTERDVHALVEAVLAHDRGTAAA